MSQPNGIVTCTHIVGSLTCISREATIGLTMKFAASLLSLGALLYMFLFIVYANRHTLTTGIRIFYTDMDILIFSLLCASFVQAISGLLNLKWILDGIVEVGPFCDAQGILAIFGGSGIALSTLLVAAYTFGVISIGRGFESTRITGAIVVGIWVLIAILLGVGHGTHHNPRFISPRPYWCWLSAGYLRWMIGIEYLWLWAILIVSPLLYIPLYLWMRGNLVFRESVWYRWSLQSRSLSEPNPRSTRRTWVLLLYPAVSYVCIFPLSVVRWLSFVEVIKDGNSGVQNLAPFFAASTIFSLTGFFNVILVFTTKPKLGLFGQQERTSLGRVPSLSRPETESEVVVPMKTMSPQTP